MLFKAKMDTVTRVQILDVTDCISHSTNTFGKGMNPIILPPAMRKIVGQLLTFVGYFNAKSIFMKIVLFQTIQFSISTQFKCKYSSIEKNISISSYSV